MKEILKDYIELLEKEEFLDKRHKLLLERAKEELKKIEEQ